jgi:hypothetical protein
MRMHDLSRVTSSVARRKAICITNGSFAMNH